LETHQTGRRQFLKGMAGVAAGAAVGGAPAARPARAASANEKIILGVMGLGIRGPMVADDFADRPDVHIAYLCDVDTSRFERPLRSVSERQDRPPAVVQDFRRILDDRSVDAIIIATPDHWHALPTILACQAGKDVLVEKPVAHNIWEGRQMIAAARKYGRIVQVGTQTRSAVECEQAVQYIRDGKLGEVHLVRVLNMKYRPPIGRKEDAPVPPGVDYDMWLGPAPHRPFNPNHFHYNWHWFWDYSGGDIINDGVHQLDLAHWAIGQKYPKTVVATGGKYHFDDDQETPDTQVVTYEFDRLTLVFELTLWTPYMDKTELAFRDTDAFPDWMFNSTKVEVYGSKGIMYLGRQGDGWEVYEEGGKRAAAGPGRQPHLRHFERFCQCVRDRSTPPADIAVSHLSTLLAHLGNISYRLGGRRLELDPGTETFVNDPEANALIRRTYRDPWRVPEAV
jgi:predicted dehydrogenase